MTFPSHWTLVNDGKHLYISNTNYRHMEIKYNKDSIEFEKEPNDLDELVIDFTDVLNNLNIKYVVVSGYVSILFGRSRSSEDVDLIIEKIMYDKFKSLWDKLQEKFECIITENPQHAYKEYLLQKTSIRFSRKNKYVPNIEIKFPGHLNQFDMISLKNRIEVVLNSHKMFVSPIELQISFKFFLGSEKDIEDALHLYEIFKNKIDTNLLSEFNRKLKIEELFKRYVK